MALLEVFIQRCAHCDKFLPEGYQKGESEPFGKPCIGYPCDGVERNIPGSRLCKTGKFKPNWPVETGLTTMK